jgi:hypothetical protein
VLYKDIRISRKRIEDSFESTSCYAVGVGAVSDPTKQRQGTAGKQVRLSRT